MKPRNRRGLALTVVVLVALFTIIVSGPVTKLVSTSPAEHYRDAWTHVQDNFLFEDRLDKDWQKQKDPPANLRTMAESEKAIDAMVKSLNDKYTTYYTNKAYQTRKQRAARSNVVSWRMLPNNIGYIKITTFSSENVSGEVEAALNSLQGADGFIIDLRNNGGGLVEQGFLTFSLFNDKAVYESHKGRYQGKAYTDRAVLTATQKESYRDGKLESTSSRRANLSGGKPIVILVNGGTASASESFSGAMRYNRGAVLVGQKTFGKGIMQRTFRLSGGTAIKVTSAYIYQPDGTCIHKVEMTPDHSIVKGKKQDDQLDKAVSVLKDKITSGI